MRHLSIQFIIAALILSACDMNKPKPKVERTSYTQESVTPSAPAPVATPAPAAIPVKAKSASVTAIPEVQEDELTDGALVPEEVIIQAEEERIYPDYESRKTYNETQISDDESDYPLERSSYGVPYNDTQLSR